MKDSGTFCIRAQRVTTMCCNSKRATRDLYPRAKAPTPKITERPLGGSWRALSSRLRPFGLPEISPFVCGSGEASGVARCSRPRNASSSTFFSGTNDRKYLFKFKRTQVQKANSRVPGFLAVRRSGQAATLRKADPSLCLPAASRLGMTMREVCAQGFAGCRTRT